MSPEAFLDFLYETSAPLYRAMPWREDTRPYYVLVSELMLQQTQVPRVVPKFLAFIERFPDEKTLAKASLADVLKLWQGLGYNRRAKFLHEAAKMIVSEFGGRFPTNESDLLRLPGVGKNTAGAIQAYAFNQPALYVETNVRTVYIHHFFADNFAVDDTQILELLAQTIDRENPRAFYQSLMDYGSWLKSQGVRNNAQSRHYKKQSPLQGSIREVRGQIVKVLSEQSLTEPILRRRVTADERFEHALRTLVDDGLVTKNGNRLYLTK